MVLELTLVQGEAGALGRQRVVGAGLMGCGVELSVGSLINMKSTTLYCDLENSFFNLNLELFDLYCVSHII
jgi:hypothetical protein